MFKSSLFSIVLLFFFLAVRNVASVHLTDHDMVTDPCGLVLFKGRYHIFYQFFRLKGQKLNLETFQTLQWGHSSSSNLIDWVNHEKVINSTFDPEPTFFRGKEMKNVGKRMPFSGSTIVDSTNATGLLIKPNEPILMIYSSISKVLYGEFDPLTSADFILSEVYMYYSYDGYKFKKYERPIVQRSEIYRNFRDPVVFRYRDGHFNLLMCENTRLAIYQSTDLINFKKTSTFEFDLPKDVVEWETPNLVPIGNQSFLILSNNLEPRTQSTEERRPDFHFATTRYFVGSFDGYRFEVHRNETREFDGPDLYALSVSEDNILIGMINNWKYLPDGPTRGYNGSLCYPRKIGKMQLNDDFTYLTQQFVNLDSFDERLVELRNFTDDELSYKFSLNRPHYMKIKLKKLNCMHDCNLELKFQDTNNTIRIGYTHSTNDFYLDRSESRQINHFYNDVHGYKIKYEKLLNSDEFDIDLILDVNSIELLTDRGLVAMTALHFNNRIFSTFTITTKRNYRIEQFSVRYHS